MRHYDVMTCKASNGLLCGTEEGSPTLRQADAESGTLAGGGQKKCSNTFRGKLSDKICAVCATVSAERAPAGRFVRALESDGRISLEV